MSLRSGRIGRFGKRSAVVLAAASAVGGFTSSLFALTGTFTYTAGGTSWTNPNAWLFGNPYPNGIDQIANFTTVDLAPIGPVIYPITLDTIITVGTLNFADANTATPGGWQISQGGTSTLTLATTAGQPVVNVGAMGANATVSLVDISVPVYGTQGFIKQGAGLLRLSGANVLTGSLNVQQGTLEIANLGNLGATDATITLSSFTQSGTQIFGGVLSLRSDTAFNLTGKTLVVAGSSSTNGTPNILNVDRTATSGVTGVFHNLGTILMAAGGGRQLNVVGSNFFGLNVGTLVLDPTNSAAILNNLSPGQLSIGTVVGGSATTASTITFGGTNNVATGNGIVITNSIVQSNVSGTLSVVYSDAHTLNIGSFVGLTGNLIVNGNGTLIVNAGRLPTGSLGVSNGTLDFSATGLVSTVTHLQMGGGTASYINTGTVGGLNVTGNVTFSASTGGLGGVIDGNVAFGPGSHTLQINGINGIPTQEMTVNAAVSGSGTLTKNGSGQILLAGANTLSAAVVINQGTLSGAARGSGNSLSSGPVTIGGGTLRLVNTNAIPGSGSIGSLDFNGAATNPAILMVDSGTASAATSLNIGAFLGRVSGSTGALTVIPKTGGLDSSEIITVGSMATAVSTATNHGILAPYVAAQASSSNSSIDFLATSGTHVVGGGAAYQTGDINAMPANSIFSATGAAALTAGRQMFALKANGTLANVSGGATITLGDGVLAGLIVDNGAQVTASNIVINAAEAIFWAGGRVVDIDGTTVLAAGGSISSNISFATTTGALTTSGAETLTLSGGFDMGGQTRTVTVSNGTAIFAGPLSNGSLLKSGPSYMILTNANAGMTGNLNSASGTLQIGQGLLTPSAGINPLATATVGNGNIVLNLNGVQTLPNLINSTGTGALIVDSPTGVIVFNNASSNFSSLTVQSGAVQLNANNQLPSAATLTVQNIGSFNMNGFSQTIGALDGNVGTGIVSNSGAGFSTLTINRASNTSTFSGQITNGAGIALNKLGAGTQILAGSDTYSGGTRLVAGVLQLNNSNAAGTGSIQFVGGTLALGNGANVPNALSIGSSTGTITVAPGGNTGTLSGPITVSGGTLVVNFGGNNGTISVLAASLASSIFNGSIIATGTGSGVFRIPANTNASGATIDWGTSTSQILLNATATIGFLTGGANGSIQTGQLSVGALGGQSSWAGLITTGTVTKIGPGTFTLSSTTNKNHTINNLNSNAGAVVIGQNAQLTNGINVTMNGGDVYFAGNANFTSTATVNLSQTGAWDVTQVPGGYPGAASLTVQGSGTIRGAYIHGSGTLSPGGSARAGTITFSSLANPAPLTMGSGLVQLDFASPGTSSVGAGTNDLLVVNGNVNFNPNTFYRFNYIGSGSVSAGDDYPLMYYTGAKTGWGAGSISTTAGQVRSAFRADMVLKEIGTPGAGLIAAHVNSVGGQAQTLTWVGTASNIWDLNLTQNFKNPGGAGTTFFQLDTVVFDDNALSHPSATLETAVFLPAQVIVNNGSNAAGIIRIGSANNNPGLGSVGTLSGGMQLIKNGTGRLELNGYNSYTGGTVLNAGTLATNPGGWSERLFDHAEAASAGVGSIMFTSTTGAATLTSNWNIPNDINIPAGVIANLIASNQGNNTANAMYFTAPFTGSGTINLYTNGIPIIFRNSLDSFTGNANVAGDVQFSQSTSVGSQINWSFVTPQRFNFNWGNDFNAGDSGAIDTYLAALNGPANVISVASGRRPGTLHIGAGGANSLWTGVSMDAWGSGNVGSLTNGNGNGTFSIGNGIMSLTKEGTGLLTMTGSHGYTGATTVNGGVLQLSNTGGPGGTPIPNSAIMTGTRVVRANGGTFRLGTPGGGLLAGNNGTITTAATGLLLEANGTGNIDVTAAYDDKPEVDPDSGDILSYNAFKTATGVTWAGNGGTVVGYIRHSGGTISPGSDTGAGKIGTLNFANTLELFNGAVTLDVGSVSSAADRIVANTLNVGGGNVVVNVIGNSIPANGVYTIMTANSILGGVSSFAGLILQGRGATGSLIQAGPSNNQIQLKIATPAVSDNITWNGGSGGTWDVKGGQNWRNHNNTPDYFYHGDTVTFTDTGAGTIALASNVLPTGQVLVNNTATTYTFAGPGKITGAASLRKSGTGTLKLLGFNDYTGGTTIDAGGTLVLGADNVYASNTLTDVTVLPLLLANHGGQAGTGSIVNNGKLVVAGATAMVLPNNISGSGAVYFRDIGTTRLDGTNTWLGGTTISNGVISLGHDNGLPTNGSLNFVAFDQANLFAAGGSTFMNNRTVRLDLRGFQQTILELSSFGTGAGNTSTIYNSNAGTQQISTLTIGRTGPTGWHGTIRENLDGDSASTCWVALTKMSDGSADGGVATIDATGNAQPYAYAGETHINAGTYIFVGSHFPAQFSGGRIATMHSYGTYTVAGGAALSGSFLIQTTVDVKPGGKLAPGWAGATSAHTAAQDLLKLNSSDLYLGLYGLSSDLISIPFDNGLTVSGISQVHLNGVNVQAGTFTLLDYQGAALPDLLSNIQLNPLNITNPGTFNYTLVNNIVNTSLDLVVTQPIVSTTWQADSNGTWSTGANWTTNPTTPNAFGSTANFGSITAPRTVTMDGPFNIGTANFTSASAFTIAGTGVTTLNMGNLAVGSAVGINVTAGSHAINVPVQWNNDGTISVSAGARLSVGGGFGLTANGNFSGHNVTKDGAGTLLIDNVRNTFGNDGTAVLRVKQGNVQILHHTTSNNAVGTSKVNSLAIDNGTRLDLTNNSMVIDYGGLTGAGTLLTQVRGWIKSTDGRLFSSDADATHGIGYRDNTDSSGAANQAVGNFSGVTVDASSILMKYTYLGDGNLDGQVDINDLYNVASNYNPNHTGSATAVWQKGDFNYDGWVDLLDLTKLTTNWQAGVGNPLGSSLGPILASLGLPNVAVPEPATIGIMGLGLTGLMARRRRRN